jgi:hypothetical protein
MITSTTNRTQNDLEYFAKQYLENNRLICNVWNSEAHPDGGQRYGIFVFTEDKWIIQHNSCEDGLHWKLVFKNPNDELKRKIMTMILKGSKLWYK